VEDYQSGDCPKERLQIFIKGQAEGVKKNLVSTYQQRQLSTGCIEAVFFFAEIFSCWWNRPTYSSSIF
jgi:hypothetical protein